MRVIAVKTLRMLWSHSKYRDAEQPLRAWFHHARQASWNSSADLKRDLPAVSILKDGRAVFNIHGNKYRLIVHIHYPKQIVFIRFVGTHAEYDKIDANTI